MNSYSLLFTGLLINRESVPEGLRWLHEASFFHAAFEALAVNELRYLTLKQHKVCFISSTILISLSKTGYV
jgi:hypothetical protein